MPRTNDRTIQNIRTNKFHLNNGLILPKHVVSLKKGFKYLGALNFFVQYRNLQSYEIIHGDEKYKVPERVLRLNAH